MGIMNDKGAFLVDTPHTPRHWYNKLFNDNYVLEINQMMQGSSQSFVNYKICRHIGNQRHFYIKNRDTGEIFCPLHTPLNTKADEYRAEYALGYQRAVSTYKGIECQITAFVPVEGTKEIWTIKIANKTENEVDLSLFTAFSFGESSWMGCNAEYDEASGSIFKYTFPAHAFYDDKNKFDDALKCVYMHCTKKIDGFETNKYRFYGSEDDTQIPSEVMDGRLKNTKTQGEENIIGAMQNNMVLQGGEEVEVSFVLGAVAEKSHITDETDVDVGVEFERVCELWDKRCSAYKFATGDEKLDTLANYWLKKQVTYLARTNRLSASSPVRNELQDAMGYAFAEPKEAFEIMKRVLSRQFTNGYIKQWNIHDGSGNSGLALLRHTDAPIWIVICFIETISYIIGDTSLYTDMVGYDDSDEKESVLEHIRKAAYFMSGKNELGEHGLCLMRDGDWTDPMNAPGRFGRGESVWNSMALVYAIRELLKVDYDAELEKRANELDENINKYAWDGEWYLAAIDDNGRKVGTHEDDEGKIFLNTQTWAVISGVAKGDRLNKVCESTQSLKTVCGYKLLEPAFSCWNEKWGKISIKQMGALENGAVYCHGTMFKALGDVIMGDYTSAMEAISDTLPTNPKNADNMQLPLYVPNYYFGLENENFGRSSCVYNTGTGAWILVLLNRMRNMVNNSAE